MRLLVLLFFFATVLITTIGSDELKQHEKNQEGEKAAGVVRDSTEEAKNIDSDKTNGSSIFEKTRMLFYEYSFTSKTTISGKKFSNSTDVTSSLSIRCAFDILHHDSQGNILARYKLLQCISGPCDYQMPDVFVEFIQGGNNLEGLFVQAEQGERVNWNPLFAIISSLTTPAISGAGDEQNVVTPYGLCHYKFLKPQDKIFRRRISECYLDGIRNHSLVPQTTVHRYEQDILYTQNARVNADIVVIEAKETMELRSPLSDSWDIIVKTEFQMEMENKTLQYDKRVCPFESLARECAQNVFGARRLGKSWKEIKQNMQMGKKRAPFKLKQLFDTYRKVANKGHGEDPESRLPTMFGRLVDAVMQTTESELLDCLENFKGDRFMNVLINAIGAAGTAISHQTARKFLTKEASPFLKTYLQSLALSTRVNPAITSDLKEWLDNCDESEEQICTQVAYTLANLHRRYCELSTSRMNECNKGKNQEVNNFFTKVTQCTKISCHKKAIRILMNLPIARVVPYASSFLCASDNESLVVQEDATRLLSLTNTEFIDSQTINKLMRIFRNACPRPQSTTAQTLATEVLLNAVPHHTAVGTYLLRSESLVPDNHAKWAFFYDSVARRRCVDDKVDEYWRGMRRFRVFRPNYSHRGLLTSTNVFAIDIAEKNHLLLSAVAKTEFNGENFKRSEFSLDLFSHRRSKLPLFEIITDTSGLSSILSDSEADEENDDADPPHASAQLSLFNSRLPAVSLFDGYADLMSAVWNANGDLIEAYKGNLVFRQYITNFPLLSGLSLAVDVTGSVSLRVTGTVEISLWNKDATSTILTDVSASLDGTLTLLTQAEHLGEVSAHFGAVSSVVTKFDVNFADEPYLYCTIVSQGPLHLTNSFSYGVPMITDRVTRVRKVPPRSFALNLRTSRMCSQMVSK